MNSAGEILVADLGTGSIKVLSTCGGESLEGSACAGPICNMSFDYVYGCTDSSATNYMLFAQLDDGSCEYACDPVCENGGTCNAVGHCICSGTGHHGVTCTEPDIASCASGLGPAFEVCDGLDNDCNGVIDDGMGSVTCGIGGCLQSVTACVNGIEQDCDPLALKSDEICDGVDNDCDGQTDEGQGAAYCGFGVCKRLVSDCVDGVPTGCDPFDGASPEACNSLDDDCDGLVDEGFGEVLCGTGVCRHVQPNCLDGVAHVCDPMKGAYSEDCDGLDNNCDGVTDEDMGQLSCGVGECAKTINSCQDGVPQSCNAFVGASAEVCDGKDNDCNGLADDGLAQISCGLGACAHSIVSCVGGVLQVCDPMEGASVEVCDDGVDNNCDGVEDDGCAPDLDGDSYRADVDCNDGDSAINPGAVEACADAVDNNCDGQVDEGCVPESHCVGDFTIGSMAAMEDISHCETIDGYLVVMGSTITSLDALQGLREVTGKLRLYALTVANFAALSDLESVGGNVEIIFNYKLQTLSHLGNLVSIGGGLDVENCAKLSSLDGLDNVVTLPGSLRLYDLDSLGDVDGLSNLTSVGNALRIEKNKTLQHLAGLSSLVSVGGAVVIDQNEALMSLAGLAGLTAIGLDISVTNNSALCMNEAADFIANICSLNACQTSLNSFNKSSDCASCGGSVCNSSCGECGTGMACREEVCVCTEEWQIWMSWDDAVQTIELPACANEITVDLHGAQGGWVQHSDGDVLGGLGARMQCKVTGLGGQTLYMRVGSKGGAGGAAEITGGGGGGGGATAVWTETNGVKTPLVIAGGGGGASTYQGAHGEPGTIMEWGSNGGQAKGTGGFGGGTGMNDGDGYGGGGGGWNGVGETSMKWPDSSSVIASGGDVHSGLKATGGWDTGGGGGGFGAVAGGGQAGWKGGGGGGGYSGGGGGLVAVSTGGQLLAAIGGGGGGSLCTGVIEQATSGVSEDNGYLHISAAFVDVQSVAECEAAGATPEVCDGTDNDCDGDVDEGACFYKPDAMTVLQDKCSDCHSTLGIGGHNIASSYDDALLDASSCQGKTKAECSIQRIEDGSMPLGMGCGGAVADGAPNADYCVTESELAILKGWSDNGHPECDGPCPVECGEGAYSLDGVTCVDCEPCPAGKERVQCGGFTNTPGPGLCMDCPAGSYKEETGTWDTLCNDSGYKLFTSGMTWELPTGVSTIRILAIGGGGGGGSHHGGGGGSGEVKYTQATVSTGQLIVMVGGGGTGGSVGWDPVSGSVGAITAVGDGNVDLVVAWGGKGGSGDFPNMWGGAPGGNGGSGGGGANRENYPGCRGGANGSNAPSCIGGTATGGSGSGFDSVFSITRVLVNIGLGGVGGGSILPAGGGGGGLNINGSSITGNQGSKGYSGAGGRGYGAGGGGGGCTEYQGCAAGGKGANGVVYIEW